MKRYGGFIAIVAWIGLLVARLASAQGTNCAEILRYAGESWETKSDIAKLDSSVRFFCSNHFKSEKEAKNAVTGAGFIIDAIPFNFKGDFSDEQFQEEQNNFCRDETTMNWSHAIDESTRKTLNETVARAVADCVKAQSQGLYVWLETTNDNALFKVHAALRGTSLTAKLTDFKVLPPQNCTGSLDGPIGGQNLVKEVACQRDPHRPVVVSVNATNFAIQWLGESSLPADLDWNCTFLPLDDHPKYSTEGDSRAEKTFNCPEGFTIVPGSGYCLATIPSGQYHVSLSKQVGNSWLCHWDPPLEKGVGIWAEAACRKCPH